VTGPGDEGRVLHILTGCTGVGKTEWALRWAETRGAEILSCDSLLFYRRMDLGTAKPSASERRRVPHHLVDIRPVSELMNVATYASLARAAAEEIAGRGRPVLVVGGSGFYLKTFFAPVADAVEVGPEIQEAVGLLLRTGGPGAAVEELRRLNPGGLGRLDVANPRRVANALTRCLASGRSLGELAEDFSHRSGPFAGWEVRLARLDRSGPDFERRLASRIDVMLGAGLVEEVRVLLAAGLRSNPSAAAAIGYRETVEVLEGRAPREGLADAIARRTRALVKKQRTWFRTQLPPHPVHDPEALSGPEALF
jgi:tRNA dimethylallyltransferase